MEITKTKTKTFKVRKVRAGWYTVKLTDGLKIDMYKNTHEEFWDISYRRDFKLNTDSGHTIGSFIYLKDAKAFVKELAKAITEKTNKPNSNDFSEYAFEGYDYRNGYLFRLMSLIFDETKE